MQVGVPTPCAGHGSHEVSESVSVRQYHLERQSCCNTLPGSPVMERYKRRRAWHIASFRFAGTCNFGGATNHVFNDAFAWWADETLHGLATHA